MQKQSLTWNIEPAIAIEIRKRRETSTPFVQLVHARGHHRPSRMARSTWPRRESCLNRRALLAALREAELAEWQATGGDFLNATHKSIG